MSVALLLHLKNKYNVRFVKWVIHVESIICEKVNRSTVNIGINTSNIAIMKLKLNKDRKTFLEQKGKDRSAKKRKFMNEDVIPPL
uniref:Uncharacterized protein n=1 Tax=Physcomitrium patens TaxID=3218 RepID=A0A7I4AP95_PHYPA